MFSLNNLGRPRTAPLSRSHPNLCPEQSHRVDDNGLKLTVTQRRPRLRHTTMRARAHQFVLIALLVSACGADAGTTTEEPATTPVPSSTTSTQSPTSTTPDTSTTSLAGAPIDFGPNEGDVLWVIGVAYDDVLNFRAGPGVDTAIVREIPPTYDNLSAAGNTRQLPDSFWAEVEYEGARGWVNMIYVGYPGPVDDLTANVIARLGEHPTSSDMTDLADEVAGVFTQGEEPGSFVVQVTPVGEGDLGEVTYDVIGLADDSIRGLRLHIFAERGVSGFELKTVEVRSLCDRGPGEDACP